MSLSLMSMQSYFGFGAASLYCARDGFGYGVVAIGGRCFGDVEGGLPFHAR